MNEKDLLDVTNDIDDDLLKEAHDMHKGGARTLRVFLIAAAAVLLVAALVVGGVFLLKRPEAPVDPTSLSADPTTASIGLTTETADPTTVGTAPTEDMIKEPGETAAIVYIEVNPSVAVLLDAKKTVVAAVGVNNDGKALTEGGDFVGRKAEKVVTDVVSMIIEQGYLTSKNNRLSLSAVSEDQAFANELCEDLEGSVDALLKNKMPDAVLTVDLRESDKRHIQLIEMEIVHGVSLGEAKCILNILDAGDQYTLDELLNYEFSELSQICKTLGLPDGTVDIGIEKAKKIALDAAGLKAEDVDEFELGSGQTKDIWTYDVGFYHKDAYYAFTIDADTGEILDRRYRHIVLSEQEAIAAAANACSLALEDLTCGKVDLYSSDTAYIRNAGASFLIINFYSVYLRDGSRNAYYVQIDAETGEALNIRAVDGELLGEEIRAILERKTGKRFDRFWRDKHSDILALYSFESDGVYYHCIIHRYTGEVYAAEHTKGRNCSTEFKEEYRRLYDLQKSSEEENAE